jgi:hypothetical protein
MDCHGPAGLAIDDDNKGWRQQRWEIRVDHLSGNMLAIETKQFGAQVAPGQRLVGADWSVQRDVNGKQTVVNRPFAFPLTEGKIWIVDYTQQNPNWDHLSEHFHNAYKVVGWEDVTVPAGTFHALKIEDDGTWDAVVAPSVNTLAGGRVDAQGSTAVAQANRVQAHAVSGRLYKAFWYAPSVKRWVKSVEEFYSASGQRNEAHTGQLVSVSLAP